MNFTDKEIDYILDMLKSYKESLDDCCNEDRKVVATWVNIPQEEADEEYALIDSLFKKFRSLK